MKPRRVENKPQALRCAVYTRKSSEEGLDQAFNSLHAQRESCEAYIRSQAGEGWSLIKTGYDDGGFSGGNMDRPALKQLLADVAAGRVDVIVVYKVDRLTRSLMDFAKIVEVLDGQGVSFVSVTQAFNTTTSMGRLTLNVLLSFAQFEREVTGERIRDKIAASKAKGIWMGGVVPLGYDAVDRALKINDAEADLVRSIFHLYLELRSMPAVLDELEARGVRTKSWISRKGRALGGARFSLSMIAHLLTSQIYIGKIVHRGEVHQGLHPAIVPLELFQAVQEQLAANRVTRSSRPVRAATAPLTGLIFDAEGAPMSPSFSYSPRKSIYRYYVSPAVLPGRHGRGTTKAIRRVSAPALETFVAKQIQQLTGDHSLDWARLRAIVTRVEIGAEGLSIALLWPGEAGARRPRREELQERLPAEHEVSVEGTPGGSLVRIVAPIRPVFHGGRSWLNKAAAEAARPRTVNAAMVEGLKRSHRVLAELKASPLGDRTDLAQARAPVDFRARQVASMGFLAPDIQRAILEGRQPSMLTISQLFDVGVPLSWAEQRRVFGFDA